MAAAAVQAARAFATPLVAPLVAPLASTYAQVFSAAAPYVLSVPALVDAGNALNAAAGNPGVSVARVLLSMLLAYPAGLVSPWLPAATLRHAWSFGVGVVLVQFVFGVGYLHLLLPSLAVYLLLAVSHTTGLFRGVVHWLCAALAFAYLMFRHASRAGVTSSNVDDSTLGMVLVIKLFSLSYNLFDGTADAARLAAERATLEKAAKAGDENAKRKARVIVERQERAISTLPGPLEYLGYVFAFPSVFSGPAFEISEYLAAQRLRKGATGAAPAADAPTAFLATRYVPALWKLLQGIVWLGASAVLGAAFPTSRMYDLAVATSPPTSYLDLARFVLCAMVVSRFQYYAIWKLAEGSAVLAGFGYRGKGSGGKANPAVADFEYITGWAVRNTVRAWLTPRVDSFGMGIADMPDWEGVCNVNPVTVETRISISETISNWNMATQSWLARYIFMRLPQGVNKHMTFLASAFWHGFFPGYYLTFFTFFLVQESGRALLASLDKAFGYTRETGSFLAPKAGIASLRPVRALLWVVQFAIQTLAMCYAGTAFMLFKYEQGVAVWAALRWSGHIATVAFFALSVLLGALAPKKARGEKVVAPPSAKKGAKAA